MPLKKQKKIRVKKPAVKKVKVTKVKKAKPVKKKVVVKKSVAKKKAVNPVSLDQLFDSLFIENPEPPKPEKSLDQLFDEVFPVQDNSKVDEFDAILDEFIAESQKTKVVGPTSTIIHSANENLERYEQALAEAISPKFVLRKLALAASVALGTLVIGVCWLQVTYGYFTELDNVSTSGGIQEIIGQNAKSFNTLQQQSSESLQKIMQRYQDLNQ